VAKRAKVPSGSFTTPDPATFRTFLDLAPDGIVIVDQHGRITYVNSQTEHLFGYHAGELVGKPVELLVPAGRRAAPAAKLAADRPAPMSRPMGQGRELVGRHKDGGEIPVEISLRAVTTDQGAWVIRTIRDMRERRPTETERIRVPPALARPRERAEAEVRQALRDLADTIPAGVLMSDARGEIVLSNAVANELLGGTITGTAYGPAGRYTLHRPDGSPFPPSDLPLVRAIEKGETTSDVTILVRYASGVERVVLAAGTPRRDPDGRITGAIAVFQDITEREQIQKALREREEWLGLVTAHSPDMMFFQDHDLRFRWLANPTPPFTAEMVLGRTDDDLLPRDQAAPLVELKKKALASGEGTRTVVHRVRPEGDRYFEIAILPGRDKTGNVIGVFGYVHDVTERKRTEEELARLARTIEVERSRLQSTLDSAINPIIFVDAETGDVRANPEAEKLFGPAIIPEAGRAQYVGQFYDPEGQLIRLPNLLVSRVLRGERPARQELLIVRPDGSKVPVVENAGPIRMADGTIVGAVAVFQDVSPLKELERVREEWTSVIAHDLRQPVTVIAGYAGLLVQGLPPTSPAAQAPLNHILTSARQLNRMIGDLLDASRIEARRLKLERGPVNLPALVRDAAERAIELTQDRAVSVRIRGAIPTLELDPGRIEQVLANLLSNAAKYGAEGCPIEVEVERSGSDVQVAVANRGEGIAPDELRVLFSRFYRTKSAEGGGHRGSAWGCTSRRGWSKRTADGSGPRAFPARPPPSGSPYRSQPLSTPDGESTPAVYSRPVNSRERHRVSVL
jgi:PAS domain S-box-containing protein